MYSSFVVMAYPSLISNHSIPENDSHYLTTSPSVYEYSHNGQPQFEDTYKKQVDITMNISYPNNKIVS